MADTSSAFTTTNYQMDSEDRNCAASTLFSFLGIDLITLYSFPCATVCYKFKKVLINSTSLRSNLKYSQRLKKKTTTPLRSKKTVICQGFAAQNLDRHRSEQGVLQHKHTAPTLFEQEVKKWALKKTAFKWYASDIRLYDTNLLHLFVVKTTTKMQYLNWNWKLNTDITEGFNGSAILGTKGTKETKDRTTKTRATRSLQNMGR